MTGTQRELIRMRANEIMARALLPAGLDHQTNDDYDISS